MSRIGNNPVKLPPKVEVTLGTGEISVKGPLGTLSRTFGADVTVERNGEELVFKATNDEAGAHAGNAARARRQYGQGCHPGLREKLSLVGVGYRAQAAGDKINLSLGFSHPVVHLMPKGVTVQTPVQTEILVKGIDKQQVGQVAAEIRAYRPPEPYKGKGVRYADERVNDQGNEEEVTHSATCARIVGSLRAGVLSGKVCTTMNKKKLESAARAKPGCASPSSARRAWRWAARTATSTRRSSRRPATRCSRARRRSRPTCARTSRTAATRPPRR